MARSFAVSVLALALVVLPSLALAQGPADQPPDAPGDQGPPDQAGASDQAGANGQGSADAAPPEPSNQQDEAPEDEPQDEPQASPDDADGEASEEATSSPEASPASPQETGDEDASDAEDEPVEAPAAEASASEPTTEDAEPEADDGTDDTGASGTSEEPSAEVGADETSTEVEDTTDTEDEPTTEAVEDDAADDVAEDTEETTDATADEATTMVFQAVRSTTDTSNAEVEEDEADEATTVESSAPSKTHDADPDAASPEDGTDADVATEAAEAEDLRSGTAGPVEASNPSTAPSAPWSGPQRSTAQSATPSWAATVPETSISWLLPSLAIGAVGAFALVRARTQTRTQPRRTPAPASEQPPEATQTDEEPDGTDASARELPEPGLEGVLGLGQQALDEGDLETAVGWFETAVAISPNAQAAHFCMGMCLGELDRLEEAADALENALELQPGDPLALFAQAGVQARRGRTGDALELAARLAREYPEFREAMAEDEAFDRLRDHPRFLALIGEL